MSASPVRPETFDEEPTDPAVKRFAIARGGGECEADRTYAGRFKIVDELASGGMGIVYEAEDLERGVRVAFKVLRKGYQQHPRAVESFLAEGRFLCEATSPSIPKGYAFGIDPACGPYVAMEILRGHTVAELAREPWTEQQVAALGVEIARALAPLHADGLVHRDLKPQNLLVATDSGGPAIRLLDWGIAQRDAGSSPRGSSSREHLAGTPRYMSPEQIRGERATATSDVYALGVVLYELLAQRFCYGEEADAYVPDHVYAMWHQHATLVPIEGASSAARAALEASLARDPRERAADGAALATVLEAWLEDASRHDAPSARASRPPALRGPSVALPAAYRVRAEGPDGTRAERTPAPIKALSEEVHGRIEVLDGPTAERFFDLRARSTLIGRGAACDVILHEPSLSLRHASIAIAETVRRFLVRDERSRNGTRVNGVELPPNVWRPLQHGDRLSMGRVELMFHSVAQIVAADVKRGGTVALAPTPQTPDVDPGAETITAKPTLDLRPVTPRQPETVTADALPLVRIAPAAGDGASRPPPSRRRAPVGGDQPTIYSGRAPDTVPAWLIVLGLLSVGLGAFFLLRALGM